MTVEHLTATNGRARASKKQSETPNHILSESIAACSKTKGNLSYNLDLERSLNL